MGYFNTLSVCHNSQICHTSVFVRTSKQSSPAEDISICFTHESPAPQASPVPPDEKICGVRGEATAIHSRNCQAERTRDAAECTEDVRRRRRRRKKGTMAASAADAHIMRTVHGRGMAGQSSDGRTTEGPWVTHKRSSFQDANGVACNRARRR